MLQSSNGLSRTVASDHIGRAIGPKSPQRNVVFLSLAAPIHRVGVFTGLEKSGQSNVPPSCASSSAPQKNKFSNKVVSSDRFCSK